MTWEEWEEKYQPEYNQILGAGAAPLDGYMYETYGQELDYVKARPIRTIWTILDTDGELYLSMGYHYVNRFGYVITEVPWTDDELTKWQNILID
jgi:hypothetical protein